MTLPPVEPSPRSMTRRHYLVERNRLRVKAYEPTRKSHEEEDIRLAEKRMEERGKMLNSWKSQTSYNPDDTRPLPGGGPRSRRMREAAALKNPNYYKIIKDEEAKLKAERQATYKADMAQQLKERREFLAKTHADEKAYSDALVESHTERARTYAEREREEREANKAYMDQMRETNLRELDEKRRKAKEREAYELSVVRSVQKTQEHKAQQEEARAKDMKLLMKLENEENHRLYNMKRDDDKAREEAELKAMLDFNNALAERERREQMQKKADFKREFEESIAKDKEFRRTHDYDEPLESIRRRNEAAAASHALITREEKLRDKERRHKYRDDLMEQIHEKQVWQMSHLDGV